MLTLYYIIILSSLQACLVYSMNLTSPRFSDNSSQPSDRFTGNFSESGRSNNVSGIINSDNFSVSKQSADGGWRQVEGTESHVLANGTVVWGQFAGREPVYRTRDHSVKYYLLGPFFNFAIWIVNTITPEEPPLRAFSDLFTLQEDWSRALITVLNAFLFLVVILVLFILEILEQPVAGCRYYSARSRGHHGGNLVWHPRSRENLRRSVYSVVVVAVGCLLISAAACGLSANEQVHNNLDDVHAVVGESVTDAQLFVEHFVSQLRVILGPNAKFLEVQLKNTTADIPGQIAKHITALLEREIGLGDHLNEIEKEKDSLAASMNEMSDLLQQLRRQHQAAVDWMALTNAQSPCMGCMSTLLAPLIKLGPEFDKIDAELNSLRGNVSTDVFKAVTDDVASDIASIVNDSANGIKAFGILDTLHDDHFKPQMDKIEALKLESKVQEWAKPYQTKLKEYTDWLHPYECARWIVLIILLSVTGTAGVLMVVGTALGLATSKASTPPTKRSKLTDKAGLTLMAAMYLMYASGWLIALAGIFLLLLGAGTERYLCQSFDDPIKLEWYARDLKIPNKDTRLASLAFDISGRTITFGVAKLIESCRKGETLYTALHQEKYLNATRGKIDEMKRELFLADRIDMSGLAQALLSLDLQDDVDELQSAANSVTQLQGKIIQTDDHVLTVCMAAERASPGAENNFIPMRNTLTDMTTVSVRMQTQAQNIAEESAEIPGHIKNASARLENETYMEPRIKSAIDITLERGFELVDSFFNDTENKLETEVGRCTPMYYIFRAIAKVAFCQAVITPLNGVWLALLWIALCYVTLGIEFTRRLFKYFRCMRRKGKDRADMIDESSSSSCPSDEIRTGTLNSLHRIREVDPPVHATDGDAGDRDSPSPDKGVACCAGGWRRGATCPHSRCCPPDDDDDDNDDGDDRLDDDGSRDSSLYPPAEPYQGPHQPYQEPSEPWQGLEETPSEPYEGAAAKMPAESEPDDDDEMAAPPTESSGDGADVSLGAYRREAGDGPPPSGSYSGVAATSPAAPFRGASPFSPTTYSRPTPVLPPAWAARGAAPGSTVWPSRAAPSTSSAGPYRGATPFPPPGPYRGPTAMLLARPLRKSTLVPPGELHRETPPCRGGTPFL